MCDRIQKELGLLRQEPEGSFLLLEGAAVLERPLGKGPANCANRRTSGPQWAALLWWFCIIKQRSQLLSMSQAARPNREQRLARTESSRYNCVCGGGPVQDDQGQCLEMDLRDPLELHASRHHSHLWAAHNFFTRRWCAARE